MGKNKFSVRVGLEKQNNVVQINSMSDDLAVGIWNAYYSIFEDDNTGGYFHQIPKEVKIFYKKIWSKFYDESLDELPGEVRDFIKIIKKLYLNSSYIDKYNFVEFILDEITEFDESELFIKNINDVLERKLSPYRFVEKLLVPIINNSEIDEVENALNNTSKYLFEGAHEHISEALKKLSEKENPDYRNSMKESISAVESVAKIISGKEKATLSDALKIIEDNIGLHPALKGGYIKLYHYTSDHGGIRHGHGFMDQSTLCEEDARYMLVSCSAFINYLIIKAQKAGVTQEKS